MCRFHVQLPGRRQQRRILESAVQRRESHPRGSRRALEQETLLLSRQDTARKDVCHPRRYTQRRVSIDELIIPCISTVWGVSQVVRIMLARIATPVNDEFTCRHCNYTITKRVSLQITPYVGYFKSHRECVKT